MNLTEDEAKTKWCPMARVVLEYEGMATSANRGEADDSDHLFTSSRCIGSACMMWRQAQKRNPDWKPRHAMMAGMPEHPDDCSPTHIPDPTRGHCGLAGNGGVFG